MAAARALPLALLVFGCAPHTEKSQTVPRPANEQPAMCSLIAVIARPEAYDGTLIAVAGFATFGFEANTLSLSEEDAKRGFPKNYIRLDLSGLPKDEPERKNSYRAAVGVFQHTPNDLMSVGTIQVSRMPLWPAPSPASP